MTSSALPALTMLAGPQEMVLNTGGLHPMTGDNGDLRIVSISDNSWSEQLVRGHRRRLDYDEDASLLLMVPMLLSSDGLVWRKDVHLSDLTM